MNALESKHARNDAWLNLGKGDAQTEPKVDGVALTKAIESLTLQSATNPQTFHLTNECGNAILTALDSDTKLREAMEHIASGRCVHPENEARQALKTKVVKPRIGKTTIERLKTLAKAGPKYHNQLAHAALRVADQLTKASDHD